MGGMNMHFIFILNDLDLGEVKIPARDIMEQLLNDKIWVFSKHAPNLGKIVPGSKVIVYLAGRDNRIFVSSFKADNSPNIADSEIKSEDWMKFFPLKMQISDIEIWDKFLPIKEVIDELHFITDKKNYGLFLRQGVKRISEEDFKLIYNKANNTWV
jgi:predicted RNA-binding protein